MTLKFKSTLSNLLLSKAEQKALKLLAKKQANQMPKTIDEACRKLRNTAALKGVAIY